MIQTMWTKSIQRLCLFCVALFCSLGLSLNHVQAQSVPFYWEFINVDIAVQTNGDMLVTETQKYTFTGDYENRRYRYIPLDKINKITEVSVSENGQSLPSETGTENNQLWIRWEHQLNAPESHTFVLKYRVVGGLHVDDDNAQVYWKAIFADRKAPINKARVTVELSEKFSSGIKNFESLGVPVNVRKINSKTIDFVSQKVIEPGQELEVKVTFNRIGTDIKIPQWQSFSDFSFTSPSPFEQALLIFFGFYIFVFWIRSFSKNNRSYSSKSSSKSSGRSRDRSSSYSDSGSSYFGSSDGGGGDGGGGDGGGGG
ncbi:DUF2207 domain-containing protein [Nostoc parmelioides]|uniref:DUF2207 domain-containing protein n=1 Tax=Nostoc parmelioides FACHB-3921 TaxID=2692909 RepID=A0ABR8B9V2_9NOSO|nr:DUF2207 domain-containing protein [Nostoc parmelioides]MBD2250593.1 DUF2207 domain-containing protein [Nostoc parmelioides FACHB-3921]